MVSNEGKAKYFSEEKTSDWATLISGQPRANMKKAKEEYDNIVNQMDGPTPDIFSHVWTSDKLLSIWGSDGWLGAAGKQERTEIWTPDDVVNIWKPKGMMVENNDEMWFNSQIENQNWRNGFSMTYGTKMAHRVKTLFEQHVSKENYKYVIRWRYDIHLGVEDNKSVDWKEIEDIISDNNTVIVPPGWDWGKYACCDLFAIGSSRSMLMYSMWNDFFLSTIPLHSNNEGSLRHYLEKICELRVIEYPFTCLGIHRSETVC